MATLGETRPVVCPRAFSLVVETITGWPGGSRGWWLDHGAAEEDLDTWQQKLWARGSEQLLRPGVVTTPTARG